MPRTGANSEFRNTKPSDYGGGYCIFSIRGVKCITNASHAGLNLKDLGVRLLKYEDTERKSVSLGTSYTIVL